MSNCSRLVRGLGDSKKVEGSALCYMKVAREDSVYCKLIRARWKHDKRRRNSRNDHGSPSPSRFTNRYWFLNGIQIWDPSSLNDALYGGGLVELCLLHSLFTFISKFYDWISLVIILGRTGGLLDCYCKKKIIQSIYIMKKKKKLFDAAHIYIYIYIYMFFNNVRIIMLLRHKVIMS